VRKQRTGFAFGDRMFVLAFINLIWIGPAFLNTRFLWGFPAWNAVLLLLWLLDFLQMPKPNQLEVRRTWKHTLSLGVRATYTLTLFNNSKRLIHATIVEDIAPALNYDPVESEFTVPGSAEIQSELSIRPRERGDSRIGAALVRYQSSWRLAERWAKAEMTQVARVYPATQEPKDQSIYLMRSRQLDVERRLLRRHGIGREFEGLRDYRDGDNYRDICWSATARRGKAVVKEFQIERSQPIWVVVDCGRLMRMRVHDRTKLDFGVSAALNLAQVALFGGDKIGLLAYGLEPRRVVGLGKGLGQIRNFMEQLALVEPEGAEANHLTAATYLMGKQSRRSLVVWLTDLADTAMTPDVVEGAAILLSRHLVLFAVIANPELRSLANTEPMDPEQMYRITAACEIIHRREMLLANLRSRGAYTLEVGAEGLTSAIVEQYLEIKGRNLL
jgi:uncharacterized protein (DUF58 family)